MTPSKTWHDDAHSTDDAKLRVGVRSSGEIQSSSDVHSSGDAMLATTRRRRSGDINGLAVILGVIVATLIIIPGPAAAGCMSVIHMVQNWVATLF